MRRFWASSDHWQGSGVILIMGWIIANVDYHMQITCTYSFMIEVTFYTNKCIIIPLKLMTASFVCLSLVSVEFNVMISRIMDENRYFW